MVTVLGKHHEDVRRIRRLRRESGLREELGVLVAEGPHLLEEALAAGRPIDHVLYSSELHDRDGGTALLERVHSRAIRVDELDPDVLRRLQDARGAQPILSLIPYRTVPLDRALEESEEPDGPIVVAHEIQDPGNLGAIVRTATAAGATAVVLTGAGADATHPRTVRATAGALFRIPMCRSDASAAITAFRAKDIPIRVTIASGGTPHHALDWRTRSAIVIGNEGFGLPEVWTDSADGRVHVPMHGPVESLSVAAAAAVVLFEAARQRSNG